MVSEKSLKNLAPPIKKGEVRNPLGNGADRHSTKTFKKKLQEMVEREIDYKALDGTKQRMKIDEGILTALMAKALFKQDVQAIKILIEMNDGKPPQTLQGNDEKPITHKIERVIIDNATNRNA